MADTKHLLDVLESLRERGAVGEISLPRAVAHAEAFLAAFPAHASTVIDLGSGGGLPGLVLAQQRPDLSFVFVDRRERRMDLLRLAVAQLGLESHVRVITADAAALSRDPAFAVGFDVVTARAFGEPMLVARIARPLLAPSGVVIVSEPPSISDHDRTSVRWDDSMLEALGLRRSQAKFMHVQRLELIKTSPDVAG